MKFWLGCCTWSVRGLLNLPDSCDDKASKSAVCRGEEDCRLQSEAEGHHCVVVGDRNWNLERMTDQVRYQ